MRSPLEDLLAEVVIDWVDAAALVAGPARWVSDDADDRVLASLGLLADAIGRDLVVLGDVEAEFVPWAMGPAEGVERFVREWLALDRPDEVTPHTIGWLAATAPGEVVGEEVLRAEETARADAGSPFADGLADRRRRWRDRTSGPVLTEAIAELLKSGPLHSDFLLNLSLRASNVPSDQRLLVLGLVAYALGVGAAVLETDVSTESGVGAVLDLARAWPDDESHLDPPPFRLVPVTSR